MIITLHDLQHMHYPENFSRKEKEFRAVFYKKASEFSERVIVSYDHVKDDIVKYYKIVPDKIDVCPIGIDPPLKLNNFEFIQIKKKYGLPDNYLFYAANTWRHKNHVNLIRAMKIVQNKYGQNIHLICTGSKQTDYFFEIEKEIKKYELNEHIKFLGYIPEAEMMLVMKNAKLAVIPTYYEAGSFPLIEAMNYGVPVICSDVTSLPQQIGNSQYVFNPADIDEMAAKINLMLVDKGLQLRNIENSKKRISELRWDKKVNNFVDSYKNAIAQFDKKNNRFFEEYVNNFDFFINSYYQNACLQYREAIDGYEKSIKEYGKWIEEYEKWIEEYKKRIEEAWQNQNLLKKKIERMQNTLSWKITAPLRESKSLKKVLKILKLTS
jgi:glycosyltransferase involved in cell wall biosynthesis